jgi:hypothetical protein
VRGSHHGSSDNPNSLTKKPNIWPQPEPQKFSKLGTCKAGSIYGGWRWIRTPGAVRSARYGKDCRALLVNLASSSADNILGQMFGEIVVRRFSLGPLVLAPVTPWSRHHQAAVCGAAADGERAPAAINIEATRLRTQVSAGCPGRLQPHSKRDNEKVSDPMLAWSEGREGHDAG